ncbi:MAG: phosphoenolpyruvate--protein phosphotransferase [bacterium]|nr:phosphoenolpyruvate--protein phosphotransferase [bacterium]MDE0602035.1 phosphoenolpyruvate--protein phosphotransferase [bacterium]
MIERTGIGASPGIAIGPVYLHSSSLPDIVPRRVESPDEEVESLARAETVVRERMEGLQELHGEGSEEAEVIGAHLLLLEDPEFTGEIRSLIEAESLCAEAATFRVTEESAGMLEALDDEYLAARAADVRDVGTQLLRAVLGLPLDTWDDLSAPSVLVASDFFPSETATIPPGMALGLCTEEGSPTSHIAVFARGMGLPAVVGVDLPPLEPGTMLAFDGETGEVYIDPSPEVVDRLRGRQEEQRRSREGAAERAHEPAVTLDGVRIEVAANIGAEEDAVRAVELGAEGVGLFRTEFLFLDRTRPISEEEQYEAYRTVLQTFGDHLVVVRTLDVGGDKQVPGIEIGEELNPFLGLRGIRLTLARPEMMQAQLRALLRAGSAGRLAIMAPMVAGRAELMAFRAALEEAERSLEADGLSHSTDYQVGIMIEVPSAALIASRLAPHIDFFSIGTNDLTQYTLAVDRTNREVADLADPFDPGVLRLIAETARAGEAHDSWVGVCGAMAGDPLAVPVLIGLGVTELSVAIPAVPTIKDRVRSLNLEECRRVAARCLEAADAQEARDLLSGM